MNQSMETADRPTLEYKILFYNLSRPTDLSHINPIRYIHPFVYIFAIVDFEVDFEHFRLF